MNESTEEFQENNKQLGSEKIERTETLRSMNELSDLGSKGSSVQEPTDINSILEYSEGFFFLLWSKTYQNFWIITIEN